jgi:hypothetical protein
MQSAKYAKCLVGVSRKAGLPYADPFNSLILDPGIPLLLRGISFA